MDHHHLRMLMLQQAQKNSESVRRLAELGDLALFHGRLVEVVEVERLGGINHAAFVEFTDAGGVKRRFELETNPWRFDYPFKVLKTPHDQVLDSIIITTEHFNSPVHQLQLRTERWMADPQSGDLFHADFTFWVVVDEVRPELIKTRETESFDINTGWTWKIVAHPSAQAFRNRFQLDNEPGYGVTGHSSRRAEVALIPSV